MTTSHNNHHENDYDNNNNAFNSTTVVLVNYHRLNTTGPIQKSNLVRIGDVLIEINGVNIQHLSFVKVISLLKCLLYGSTSSTNNNYGNGNEFGNHNNVMNTGVKSLSFENGKLYYTKYYSNYILRERVHSGEENNNTTITAKSTTNNNAAIQTGGKWNIVANHPNTIYKFHSYIHRARIQNEDETNEHSNSNNDINNDNNNSNNNNHKSKPQQKFIQYEIKCTLYLLQNNNQYYETSWSIWKRYTDFYNLHLHFIKTYPNTIMDNITFPSKYNKTNLKYYTWNVLNKDRKDKFVKNRIKDLNEYWSQLYTVGNNNSENGSNCAGSGVGSKSNNSGGLLFFDFGDPSSSYRYSYKMADFLNVKRDYFHPNVGLNHQRNNNGVVVVSGRGGGGGAVGSGSASASASIGSRPNVIHVEGGGGNSNDGHQPDESTVSILSNSADGATGEGGIDTGSGSNQGGGEVIPTSSSLIATDNIGMLKSCDVSVTSDGMLSGVGIGIGGKKKKKRKKVAAKSAFERRLLDDL